MARPRTSGRAPSARRMMTDKMGPCAVRGRRRPVVNHRRTAGASGAAHPMVGKLLPLARPAPAFPQTGVKWPNENHDRAIRARLRRPALPLSRPTVARLGPEPRPAGVHAPPRARRRTPAHSRTPPQTHSRVSGSERNRGT
jgi:hypothetical protein